MQFLTVDLPSYVFIILKMSIKTYVIMMLISIENVPIVAQETTIPV